MTKKNVAFFALLLIILTLGWWLLKTTSSYTALINFNENEVVTYSFKINQLSEQGSFIGNSAQFNLNGELTISKNKIHKLSFISISETSSLQILEKSFPLKKLLEGKSIYFNISDSGKIDDLYFEKEVDPTVREIMKNILSFFNWSMPKDHQTVERLNTDKVHVTYQQPEGNHYLKEIDHYTYISSIEIQGNNQESSGMLELVTDQGIPQIISGKIKVTVSNQRPLYKSTLSLEFKKISSTKEELTFSKSNLIREKLSTISIKKISKADSLKTLANNITLADITNNILSGSDPKDWFIQAKAKILLDKQSHLFLKALFNKAVDSKSKMVVLDLMASASEPRFQKEMVSILNRYEDDANYSQAVQRLSLLSSPTTQVIDYLKLEVASKVFTKGDPLNHDQKALLYTYGTIARGVDQKTHDQIYEQLTEALEDKEDKSDYLIALANSGNPQVPELIASYSDSTDPKTREAAVIALGTLSSTTSKDSLLDLAFDHDSTIANRAINELRKFELDNDDYKFLANNLATAFPQEQWVASLLTALVNRNPSSITELLPPLYRFHKKGEYTASLKRRIFSIIELCEASN